MEAVDLPRRIIWVEMRHADQWHVDGFPGTRHYWMNYEDTWTSGPLSGSPIVCSQLTLQWNEDGNSIYLVMLRPGQLFWDKLILY